MHRHQDQSVTVRNWMRGGRGVRCARTDFRPWPSRVSGRLNRGASTVAAQSECGHGHIGQERDCLRPPILAGRRGCLRSLSQVIRTKLQGLPGFEAALLLRPTVRLSLAVASELTSMVKRIIQEKQGLPVPATNGLPLESSKGTPALITNELHALPKIPRRKRSWRFASVLIAVAGFVIAVQANVFDLKTCLIGLAAVTTLLPVLRRLRNR